LLLRGKKDTGAVQSAKRSSDDYADEEVHEASLLNLFEMVDQSKTKITRPNENGINRDSGEIIRENRASCCAARNRKDVLLRGICLALRARSHTSLGHRPRILIG
jgi:hypothetical protein